MKLSKYLSVFFAAMLALAGCGGSSGTSTPPPPAIGHIYVTLANKDQVDGWPTLSPAFGEAWGERILCSYRCDV